MAGEHRKFLQLLKTYQVLEERQAGDTGGFSEIRGREGVIGCALEDYLQRFGVFKSFIDESFSKDIAFSGLDERDLAGLNRDYFTVRPRKKGWLNKLRGKVTSYEVVPVKGVEETVVGLCASDEDMAKALDESIDREKEVLRHIFRKDYHKKKRESEQERLMERGKLYADGHGFESDAVMNEAQLYIVHVTKYPPKTNAGGEYYIESLAMATDFKYPRSTVHTAINHVVEAHMEGDWDGMPYVVVAPFEEIRRLNGNPEQMGVVDTFWSVHPDTGLVLPGSAKMVEPAPLKEGVLYQVSSRKSLYKNKNYTKEEEAQILRWTDDWQRQKLEKLEGKDREAALSKIVRNHVVAKTARSMGFSSSFCGRNGSVNSDDVLLHQVAATAEHLGITGIGHKYGHASHVSSMKMAMELSADLEFVNRFVSSAGTAVRENGLVKMPYEDEGRIVWMEEKHLEELLKTDESIMNRFACSEDIKAGENVKETCRCWEKRTASLLDTLVPKLKAIEDPGKFIAEKTKVPSAGKHSAEKGY